MDFRLRVFVKVADNLSFTKAAKEMFISQPAISKHISELESFYKVELFERQGGKICLTHEGKILLSHARQILDKYDTLAYDMELLSGRFSGEIKIGASTTIAQYLISPLLADFITRFPSVKVTLVTGNSEQIENALEEHKIDVGLVEGNKRRHNLKYSHFAKDELVLVTSASNKCCETVYLSHRSPLLTSLPLVLREVGSGTLEVIEKALLEHHVPLESLTILLQIGSTEGIKQFLESSPNSYAIVSIISVLKELKHNQLKVIDIQGVEMVREFSFVSRLGTGSDRVEKFINFATIWYGVNGK
ncbi:MAG: LysR substrate-binding domain-containing protein [Bacteroidales bacterium]